MCLKLLSTPPSFFILFLCTRLFPDSPFSVPLFPLFTLPLSIYQVCDLSSLILSAFSGLISNISLCLLPFSLPPPFFTPSECVYFLSVIIYQSGFFGSAVAREVLHRVAEAVFDDDAVHGGFWHVQLLSDRPFRPAILPKVHHALAL